MQHAVDAVHSGCSEIVVYGGEEIVFGAKKLHSIHCSQHCLLSHHLLHAYHYS